MRAQKFLKLLSIVLVLFTSGCQGRYASLNNVMNQCGFKTTAFSKFHDCMNEKLPAPQAGQQDYYAQTAQDIRNELQYCSGQIHSKKMKEKQAYEYFQGYVNTKDIEEQKSAQVAGAIVAVAPRAVH